MPRADQAPDASLKLLRDAIERDVFITHRDHYIESGDYEPLAWLFDFRKITLRPDVLEAFVTLFFARFAGRYPFQVGGLETASLPLIAAIVSRSHDLGRPVNGFFIRKSRKKTGLLKLIEGTVSRDPIILIDDLMNSGQSFMRQIEVMAALSSERGDDLKILSVFSILQFRPSEHYTYFTERGIDVVSLFTLDEFSHLVEPDQPEIKKLPRNHFQTSWSWRGGSPSLEYVSPKSNVTAAGSAAYYSTDDGRVVSLDIQTGSLLWSHRLPKITKSRHPLSTPLHLSGKIYIGSHDGNIYALDAETGKRLWVYLDVDWSHSELTTDGNRTIYLTATRGLFRPASYLIALNAETGKRQWETKLEGIHTGSPLYIPERHLVVCGSSTGKVYACDAKDGTILWQQQLSINSTRPPLFHAATNRLIVSGLAHDPNDEFAPVYALEATTGRIVYTYTKLAFGSTGTPTHLADTCFVTGLDKTIHAFIIADGTPRWQTTLSARIFASPIIATIRRTPLLYVGANDAILYELNPQTGETTSMSLFAERIVNQVTHDRKHNLLLVPTYANEIYALKPKDSQD